MTVHIIDNAQMPRAFGPYSHAASAGELIFISGQPGVDPVVGDAPSGFEPQARQAFENLFTVIAAAGLTKSDIIKTTIYLTDTTQFDILNRLFADYFPDSPPTRSAPIVQLPRGLLISIEAVAVRPLNSVLL